MLSMSLGSAVRDGLKTGQLPVHVDGNRPLALHIKLWLRSGPRVEARDEVIEAGRCTLRQMTPWSLLCRLHVFLGFWLGHKPMPSP
jgi:hypothetical protein